MKYAVQYDKNFRYLNKVDEIVFHPTDLESFTEMAKFIKENISKDKVIIIDIFYLSNSYFLDKIFPVLSQLNKDYVLKVQVPFKSWSNYSIEDYEDIISKLKEENILFMFSQIITSKEKLKHLCYSYPSDIYIGGNLLHELRDVKYLLSQYGINIRVFPNDNEFTAIDSDDWEEVDGWIRPEDTDIYAEYIDVFEFTDTENASIYYDVYQSKKWQGKLNDILLYPTGPDIFSEFLPNDFGRLRANCHKNCAYKQCRYCQQAYALAKSMAELDFSKKDKSNLIF